MIFNYSELKLLFIACSSMSNLTLGLAPLVQNYLRDVSLREPTVLQELRQETALHPQATMQIAPEQGQFMALLVQLIGAKKTLDIGVFTGYSALVVALNLPPDGQVIACDTNEDFTAIARRYWQKAGVSHQIDLRIAPALLTLEHLIANGQDGQFDFAFIDADKRNYQSYYDCCFKLIRVGGIIAIDNVLWHGDVADPTILDPRTVAIRNFNHQLHHDQRVNISMVPIADGLTLAVKRG